MVLVIDETDHAAALAVIINVALSAAGMAQVQVLDRDAVAAMSTPPDDYVMVDLEVRFAETRWLCGDPATTPWRTAVETVGLTVANARAIRTVIRGVFTSLTFLGESVKPEHESSTPIGQDKQGRWSCEDVYTYSLNN